jgi:hypothetical protein
VSGGLMTEIAAPIDENEYLVFVTVHGVGRSSEGAGWL